MKTSILVVCSLAAVSGLSAIAHADDSWTETVSFSRSDASSLRITEPDGYAVSVSVDGQPVNDTVPANIRPPAGDSYYAVTLTAPSGAKWTKKIEVRSYQITDLKVKHTAATAAAPARPAVGHTYVGSMFNLTKQCRSPATVKLEFIAADGTTGATVQADAAFIGQGTLPAGTWDARAWLWDGTSQWVYQKTASVTVSSDNWKAVVGCPKDPRYLVVDFK